MSKSIKSLIARLESHKKFLADRRDRLTELMDEVETIQQDCGEAVESLQCAIDKLSEQV